MSISIIPNPCGKMEYYEEGQGLGGGAFGQVYEIEHLASGVKYAWKKLMKEMRGRNGEPTAIEWKKEAENAMQIDSPYVVRVVDYFENRSTGFIVMEFCDGGTLHQQIEVMREKSEQFSERRIFRILGEVGTGLAAMHSKGIMHRDIKSDNIFIFSGNHYKLGDLGLSKDISTLAPVKRSKAGTPGYIAPEVMDSQIYSLSADMYSLGVLAVVLCSGVEPTAMGLSEAQLESLSRLSKPTQALISSMLSHDPSMRPSAANLVSEAIIATKVMPSLEYLQLLQLKEELREKDSMIADLKHENSVKDEELKKMREENRRMEEEKNTMEEEKKRAEEATNKLEEEKRNLDEKNREIEAEMEKMEEKKRTKEEEKDLQIAKQASTIVTLSHLCNSHLSTLADRNGMIANQTAQLNEKEETIKRQDTTKCQLFDRLEQKDLEIAQLIEQKKEQHKLLAQKDESITKLEKRISVVNDQFVKDLLLKLINSRLSFSHETLAFALRKLIDQVDNAGPADRVRIVDKVLFDVLEWVLENDWMSIESDKICRLIQLVLLDNIDYSRTVFNSGLGKSLVRILGMGLDRVSSDHVLAFQRFTCVPTQEMAETLIHLKSFYILLPLLNHPNSDCVGHVSGCISNIIAGRSKMISSSMKHPDFDEIESLDGFEQLMSCFEATTQLGIRSRCSKSIAHLFRNRTLPLRFHEIISFCMSIAKDLSAKDDLVICAVSTIAEISLCNENHHLLLSEKADHAAADVLLRDQTLFRLSIESAFAILYRLTESGDKDVMRRVKEKVSRNRLEALIRDNGKSYQQDALAFIYRLWGSSSFFST